MTYLVVFLNLIEVTQLSYWPQGAAQAAFAERINSLISQGVFLLNLAFICLHSPVLPKPALRAGLLPVLLLFAWSALAIIPSDQPFRATTATLKLVTVFYVFVIVFAKRHDFAMRALRDFILFFAAANMAAVLLLPGLGIENNIASRASAWRGLMPYKTQLGITAIILFSVLFFGDRQVRPRPRTLYLAELAMLVALIAGSQSRMSWFAFGFILLTYAMIRVLHVAPGRSRLAVLLLGCATIFGLLPVVIDLALALLESSGRDLTFSGRLQIWSFFTGVGLERPLFGYGMAVVVETEPILALARAKLGWENFSSAHSTFIEWLLNSGVPGAALFACVIASTIRVGIADAWNDPGRTGMRNLALAFSILVSCLFTSTGSVSSVVWLAIFLVLLRTPSLRGYAPPAAKVPHALHA